MRVRGKDIIVTYKFHLITSDRCGPQPQGGFFTPLKKLVEAAGQCKEPLLQVSFNLT